MVRIAGFCPGASSGNAASTADTGDGPGFMLAASRILGAAPAVADMMVVPTAPKHVPASSHDAVLDAPIQYTVPARTRSGVASGLPFGLEISGKPWHDGELLGYAYGYEQATHHRHPPVLVEQGLLTSPR